MKKAKCASCGKVCAEQRNFCFGCQRVICYSCVQNYDHMGFGAPHARKPKTKKAKVKA